jgi:hypothetical protein
MAHGMNVCEASVTIPFDTTKPWSGSIVNNEPDTAVKMMAHIALTSLCEDRLTATTSLPIMHLSIRNQENPMWQQRLEAMPDHKGPHFSAVIASLAKYSQYLFNLQHNTASTNDHKGPHFSANEKHTTATSNKLARLRHENVVLYSSALPPSEQDHELKVAYH